MTELSRRRRRKPARPTRRRPKFLLFLIVVIFFATVIFGFKMADVFFAPVMGNTGDITEDPDEKTVETDKSKNGPVNILLIGTDARENEPSRSDTLILASLFPEDKQVKMLSIPRDTRVKIPGKGTQKISHAHAYGGVALTLETIEDFLGIPIDYYIKVNFQGFKSVIDTLGGVTINVEKRMYFPEEDINLQPGLQKLNGYDSLAYVRFRSDGLGDIGRVERQQKFLTALTDNVKSISTIWKIPDLIKEINAHVKTDLGTKDILYFATKFANIDQDAIETYMLPGYPDDTLGASYWIADKNKLVEVMEEMQSIPSKQSN